MAHADRILIWALGFALLVISLVVALLFVDLAAAVYKNTPSGKVGIDNTSVGSISDNL